MSAAKKDVYLDKLNEGSISFLTSMVHPLIPFAAGHVSSQQLTLATIIWSSLIILSGALARRDPRWFMLSIPAVLLHIVTDLLDGAVSEYCQDGLSRWNYFMDHFLDSVFAVSVFIGLAAYFWKHNTTVVIYLFVILILVMLNMIASFLMAGHQGLDLGICVDCFSFNIFHMHIVLLAFYTFLIFTKGAPGFDETTLIYIIILLFVLTVYNVYKKQQACRDQ